MAWLVCVEGIDGSGKGTQSTRLATELQLRGIQATTISFPRYAQTRFGRKIGEFLNGAYGELDQVHPTLVSLLFAGDRFESRQELLHLCSQFDVVICDRYVASNIAHQTAKVAEADRQELRDWIEFLEYEQHQMPRPHQTFWLDVPVDVARQWIAKKNKRDYTERAADLHEADSDYLSRVRQCYAVLAQDDDWETISVMSSGTPRTPEEQTREMAASVLARLSEHSPSSLLV